MSLGILFLIHLGYITVCDLSGTTWKMTADFGKANDTLPDIFSFGDGPFDYGKAGPTIKKKCEYAGIIVIKTKNDMAM